MVFKHLTENVWCILDKTNIGVIRYDDNKVILIDSGIDASSGEKILKILKEHGFEPTVVINTHFHTDHCGGNRFLKDRTGVKVYASKIAATVIRHPFINSFSLFSGVLPVKSFMHRLVVAEPCEVDFEIDSGSITFKDTLLQIVPLPGHAPGQIGVAVNGVLFCGDAVFGPKVIERVVIPFNVDIKTQKETLKSLKENKFSLYVPSHGDPTHDIALYVQKNLERIEEIETQILSLLEKELSTEEVVELILQRFSLKVKAVHHYFLVRSAILAYLSYLSNKGSISLRINQRPLWKAL